MKILSYILGLLLLSSLFFIGFLLSVNKEMSEERHTTLYDQNGNELFSNNHWISIGQLPSFIVEYLENEILVDRTAELLYPSQDIKKMLSKMLLKHSYTEEEIFEIYVNKLYFGNGLVGFENASQYYFERPSKDLNELEQIFLLFKSQVGESMSMQQDLEVFLAELMEKDYLLDYREFSTLNSEVPDLLEGLNRRNTNYQSYVQQVTKELISTFDITEGELYRRGFEVNTHLDRDIQNNIYETFQDRTSFLEHDQAFVEGGMAIVEHQTGKVIGLMGGREYYKSTFNRATETTRQPASTFKPLMVFGPALETGWKPDDLLKDVPMKFGDFKPRNYDYRYRGEVSIKDALVKSYNVPTTWLLYKIGLDKGLEYIDKFNLFQIDPKDGYGLALGFTSVGTSPLSIAQAYTVFPNEGKMQEIHTVESVNFQGEVAYKTKGEEERIFSKQTAETVTSLLRSVVTDGTGKAAQIKGKQIAGKTGTTSYDGWFVGFDDRYIGAVWMGPDEVIPENRMNLDEDKYAPKLFKEVFKKVE
nr:penicillin-binding transpeptidase domain-containing protein [Mesobacillus maritimus]